LRKKIIGILSIVFLIQSCICITTGQNFSYLEKIESTESVNLQIEVITGGFGVTAFIRNNGNVNATNVSWDISIDGGIVLLGRNKQGTISIIYPDKSVTVKSPIVFGFGKPVITVSAECAEGAIDHMSMNAKIFGFHTTIIPGSTDALNASLELVANRLRAPTVLTNAEDLSNRLFVAEQTGKIKIIENGELLSTPFLDLSKKMVKVNSIYDERGLLGLVFHPSYETNGKFFVYYSAPKTGAGINHESIIAEYLVSSDPNIADPNSEQIIYRVDEPEMNHNGGQLAFGPDGYLYIGLGDGGGAGDQHGTIGNGQNINTSLGKILRIDVDSGTPYAIPSDNPFVGIDGLDEIYAYGFRNPFRFSFDQDTGRLFVADVGQDNWEEIDIVEKGGNYGWAIMEGNHPFNISIAEQLGINISSLKYPIFDYSHNVGHSVIGGFVYRGNQSASLTGKYVFGDWSSGYLKADGKLYYLEENETGSWQRYEFKLSKNKPLHRFILGFGEDENGEIYIITTRFFGSFSRSGEVWQINVE
jgi:glucose/arabinose dehydrogenase